MLIPKAALRGGTVVCTGCRSIDHYMEGSVIAYYGKLLEEIVAVQEGLTEGEEELLKLLNKKLRRELSKAA